MWKGPEEFFTYTKNQRNAIVLLLGMVIAFFAMYMFWDFQKPSEKLDPESFKKLVADFELRKEKEEKENFNKGLFLFDPNTASNSDFEKLGLADFQLKRIRNFLKKGGSFSKPNDLLKIYGIDTSWVEAVISYVRISDLNDSVEDVRSFSLYPFNPNLISSEELISMGFTKGQARGIISFREKVYPFKNGNDLFKVYALDSQFVKSIFSYLIFPDSLGLDLKTARKKLDLNLVDSLGIKNIKGVPDFLLERVLKYRNRLGGFYDLKQVKEVYGLDSIYYQKIAIQAIVNQKSINKLDLNKASFKEILDHPYLDYEQVKSIVNFREKIRLFESIDELNNLELINDSLFTKIANYLEVGKIK